MVRITGDTLIGELLTSKHGADAVIRRYFGEGCFSCPAMSTEALSTAASMHGVDLETLLADVNALDDGRTEFAVNPSDVKREPFFASLFRRGGK